MEMPEIIAKKDTRVSVADVLYIIIGGILSVCVVVLLAIFHRFVSGSISSVDILLLLLFLTGKLLITGCKRIRNRRKMPMEMLTFCGDRFLILRETVFPTEIKMIKAKCEHGSTGTVIVSLENKTYTLYGVCEVKKSARRVADILAERGIEPFKTAKERFGKQ